jgi:hypothetical protein
MRIGLGEHGFQLIRAVSREIFNSRAAISGGAPRAMIQASLASAGVRRNVLAMIEAGGPGFGPKAFNVRRARTACAAQCGGPSKGIIRRIIGNLSARGTMTGSNAKGFGRGELVDDMLEMGK